MYVASATAAAVDRGLKHWVVEYTLFVAVRSCRFFHAEQYQWTHEKLDLRMQAYMPCTLSTQSLLGTRDCLVTLVR